WGVIHRPTAGPDFFQFIVAYGGEYYDPATGKLVLDRDAMLETLRFFHRLTREGLTPEGMTTWAWPSVHQAIAIDGTAGFQITGGMWNWNEWQRDFGHPEEDLFENVGFFLIPAGRPEGTPNQLGQPQAYMITSASQNKDLAALLIMLASDVVFLPSHPGSGFYSTVLYEAIGGVEVGMLTPEMALQQLEMRLRQQLGDDLIVR